MSVNPGSAGGCGGRCFVRRQRRGSGACAVACVSRAGGRLGAGLQTTSPSAAAAERRRTTRSIAWREADAATRSVRPVPRRQRSGKGRQLARYLASSGRPKRGRTRDGRDGRRSSAQDGYHHTTSLTIDSCKRRGDLDSAAVCATREPPEPQCGRSIENTVAVHRQPPGKHRCGV